LRKEAACVLKVLVQCHGLVGAKVVKSVQDRVSTLPAGSGTPNYPHEPLFVRELGCDTASDVLLARPADAVSLEQRHHVFAYRLGLRALAAIQFGQSVMGEPTIFLSSEVRANCLNGDLLAIATLGLSYSIKLGADLRW
jgi:hypothetical protein